jgi:hypothetical protein
VHNTTKRAREKKMLSAQGHREPGLLRDMLASAGKRAAEDDGEEEGGWAFMCKGKLGNYKSCDTLIKQADFKLPCDSPSCLFKTSSGLRKLADKFDFMAACPGCDLRYHLCPGGETGVNKCAGNCHRSNLPVFSIGAVKGVHYSSFNVHLANEHAKMGDDAVAASMNKRIKTEVYKAAVEATAPGSSSAMMHQIRVLEHASACKGCDSECKQMKSLMSHQMMCGLGGCALCRATTRLFRIHGEGCRLPIGVCRVPNCPSSVAKGVEKMVEESNNKAIAAIMAEMPTMATEPAVVEEAKEEKGEEERVDEKEEEKEKKEDDDLQEEIRWAQWCHSQLTQRYGKYARPGGRLFDSITVLISDLQKEQHDRDVGTPDDALAGYPTSKYRQLYFCPEEHFEKKLSGLLTAMFKDPAGTSPDTQAASILVEVDEFLAVIGTRPSNMDPMIFQRTRALRELCTLAHKDARIPTALFSRALLKAGSLALNNRASPWLFMKTCEMLARAPLSAFLPADDVIVKTHTDNMRLSVAPATTPEEKQRITDMFQPTIDKLQAKAGAQINGASV